MSTESSLDPQLIEQTKQQIRSLVAEIAQLTKEEVAPEDFYGQFLTRVVSALAAIGGAVWTTNEEGRLALQHQINLQQTKLRDNEEGQAQHGRLLYKTLSTPEGMLVPPHSGAGEVGDEPAGNPTDFLLVLGPLRTDLETVGVLEIFQRSEAGSNTQKGYLRFVLQMCELAGDFLKSHQLRRFSDRQVLWTQLEDFTHMVHTSLEPRETAYTIANEGRQLIGCDRVSVAIRKGNRCHIEAVSGQDLFDKHSNTIRLLGKLASVVVSTGEPVWYAGDTRDMAPQVEDAIEEYVDESHSKNVAVLPLTRPEPPEEDDPKKREDPEPPIGALIVEQIEDSRVPQSMVQRVEVVCRHSSTALANAMEHQNLFLMPLWRTIGKAKWMLRARTLPKTLTIAGLVLVVLLALVIWPADFEMTSKGRLEPVDRSDVFNRVAGSNVQEVFVEHGQWVKGDQLLVRLSNDDLEEAREKLLGELATVKKEIAVKDTARTDRGLPPKQREQAAADLMVLRAKEASLDNQWLYFQKKLADLDVQSPIGGQVVTWKIDELLDGGRPVERGQLLMHIADRNGPWQLELQMPEDNMGHIARAQQELYGRLRERLRKEKRKELGDETEEQLIEEVNKVPDDQLSSRLRELLGEGLLEKWQTKIGAIIEDLPAEEPADRLRNGLQQVMQANSYPQARTRLREQTDKLTDKKLADVRTELRELLEDGLGDRLDVTYILATDPNLELHGKVKEIHLNAEVQGDEGTAVLIKVEIDKQQLPHLHRGVTVTANVYCGRRPIGYVWFHDLIAFIQSRILFRYF